MKFMYVVAGTLGMPIVITVLALLGFNNGSALQQIAVSAVGVAAFAGIVTMRPKVSIMRGAPWMLGCFDVAIVGLALCGFYRMGAACWLLVGTISLWAAWLHGHFKLRPISLVISLGLVVVMLCNCLLLSDATCRSRLLAFARGEERGCRSTLAEEQTYWNQIMRKAAWFGATDTHATHANTQATYYVAQLVQATQRHGKWLPFTLCALFLILSAIMVVHQYDCSARLFGVLAALWLAAPVLLTVLAAYMLVPAANIPIPFVTCGFETVVAWVVVALGVAGQDTEREHTPVDGF